VLAWGLPRLRDLPWRRTRDPWLVLVSEVMLQQTQALRVIPKWESFRAAYPTPTACAAAPLGDVLRLWQGLGYPRRARDLHRAAGVIATVHGGEVPDELDALLSMAGIGPYTARAVLAFAFGRDVAVVDTNIARVLARSAGERLSAVSAQRLADRHVPSGLGWAWNQALMDLGASVCRPTPRCEWCPLAATCVWSRSGSPLPDPAAGSAGVSRQQRPYAGSDRQARGDVLRAVATGAAWRGDFRTDIIDSLVRDGLVVERLGRLELP
jgi:A/G-specific adenine glycosylase